MTLSGTNSYLIDCGDAAAVCIDPGPAIESHVQALLDCAERLRAKIALICLTHAHPDHAPAASLLRSSAGAPVAAHASSGAAHQRELRDGEVLQIGRRRIRVIATPGHTADHLTFYEERDRALFTGDLVLGEGYVVIAPPGGDMRAYQHSLQRVADEAGDAHILYGGHGEPVNDPQAKLRDYIEHRRQRETEILAALSDGPKTIPALVSRIYSGTNSALWPAAARQILAYLIALEREGVVHSEDAARTMTPQEAALLNPRWEALVGKEHVERRSRGIGRTAYARGHSHVRISNLDSPMPCCAVEPLVPVLAQIRTRELWYAQYDFAELLRFV